MSENCDSVTLTYSLNNRVANILGYSTYNITTYPSVVYDANNSSYYLNIANTNNNFAGNWNVVLNGYLSTGASATLSFIVSVLPYCTNAVSPI